MPSRRLSRWLGATFAALVSAFLIIPALVVIPLAFSSGEFLEFPPPGFSTRFIGEFFSDPEWTAALNRSLVIAACTAIIAVPIGTVAAYAIVRGRNTTTRVVRPVLMMPLLVPVVISGFGLYLITLEVGFEGGLPLVVLGHVGLAIPFVVTTVGASLQTFDFRMLLAARVSGASPAQAFFRILVPIIAPGIGAATLISLMVSLDEAVIALFIAGDTEPTLPVKMFSSITFSLNPLVPVAASVLTLATLILLTGSLALTRITRRRARTGE